MPLLYPLQARIIPDHSDLLSQVGERRQPMPAAYKVIGRRSQQAAGIHGWFPLWAANFGDGFFVRQQAKIPGGTQARQEIYPISEGF